MVVPWSYLILATAALSSQVSGQSSAFSSASSSADSGGLGSLSGLGGGGGLGGLPGLGDGSGLGGIPDLGNLGGSGGLNPSSIISSVSSPVSLPNPTSILPPGSGSSSSGIDLVRPLLLSLAPYLYPLSSSLGGISPYMFLGSYPFIVRYLPDILKGSFGRKSWLNSISDAFQKVASQPGNIFPFLLPFLFGGNGNSPLWPNRPPSNGRKALNILRRLFNFGRNPSALNQNKKVGPLSLPSPGAIILFYFWPLILQTWNYTIYQLLTLVWGYIQGVKYNPLPYIANALFGRNRTKPPRLPNLPQPPDWLFKG